MHIWPDFLKERVQDFDKKFILKKLEQDTKFQK